MRVHFANSLSIRHLRATGVFLVLIWGGRAEAGNSPGVSLDDFLREMGFTPLYPAVSQCAPGEIIELRQRLPLQFLPICTVEQALGIPPPEARDSRCESSHTSRSLGGVLSVSVDFLKSISADLEIALLDEATVSLANVRKVEMPDASMLSGIAKRTVECQQALRLARIRNVAFSMVRATCRADAVVTLRFKAGASIKGRRAFSRKVALGLGGTAELDDRNTRIEGKDLVWGVVESADFARIALSRIRERNQPLNVSPRFTCAADRGEWLPGPPLGMPRYGLAAGSSSDGRIFAIGGRGASTYFSDAGVPEHFLPTVEVLDRGSDQWRYVDNMPTARAFLAVAVLGDTLYAMGGQDLDGVSGVVESLDLRSEKWIPRSPMPFASHHISAAVIGDTIYVGSGVRDYQIQAYTPVSNTWWKLPAPPHYREGGMLVATQGHLYLIAGTATANWYVEVYHPATGVWDKRDRIFTGRSGGAVVESGGALYAVGGENAGGKLESVERYDPDKNTWECSRPLPFPRNFCAAASAGALVYVVGGSSTMALDSVEICRP